MKNSKKVLSLMLTIALLFSLTACGSGSQETAPAATNASETTAAEGVDEAVANDVETVKIGVMLQLSGSSPQVSEEDLLGVQLIADIINNATDYDLPLAESEGLPNLNGAKVEIVIGDAATNDAAMSECERLITDKDVVAFCGVLGSSGVKIAATAFEKYGIPYVANATSPSLTQSGYEYLIRVFPDDTTYCEGVFQMIQELNEKDNAGIRTVALCSEDSEFGTSITEIEQNLVEEYGLELAATVRYSASATNVTSEVLQLKAADADVILMSSYSADAILFMQTFKEQNYMPKMLCAQRGGFSYTEIFDVLGDDMNYVYNSSPWAADLDVPNAQLMADLYSDYTDGASLSEGCMRIMTDFYSICLAINQAGSTEADAIIKAYQSGIEIPDSQKWLSFDLQVDENGQYLDADSLVMQAYDGEYKIVYPFDFASTEYVYPVPGWNER